MVGVSDYDVHNTSLEMSRWPARAEARGNPGVKWTPRKYVALDLTLVGTERQQKIFLFAISVLRGAYCVLLALEDFQTRERERVRCRILPKATYTPFSAHLNCADGSEEFARSACWEESTNGLEGGRLYSRAVP